MNTPLVYIACKEHATCLLLLGKSVIALYVACAVSFMYCNLHNVHVHTCVHIQVHVYVIA